MTKPTRSGTERNPGGRPPFKPSDDQRSLVTALVGMGVPLATIARLIKRDGIDDATLVKHFPDEIAYGRENLVGHLKGMVVKAAQKGSVRAQTWLLERLAGPEFAPRLRLSGDDSGVPIQVVTDSKVIVYLPDNGRGDASTGE